MVTGGNKCSWHSSLTHTYTDSTPAVSNTHHISKSDIKSSVWTKHSSLGVLNGLAALGLAGVLKGLAALGLVGVLKGLAALG